MILLLKLICCSRVHQRMQFRLYLNLSVLILNAQHLGLIRITVVIFLYFWFKHNLGQKYYAPQVQPYWGLNSRLSDYDSTFHITEMSALTTRPSVTFLYTFSNLYNTYKLPFGPDILQAPSLEHMAHDLILGHNRFFLHILVEYTLLMKHPLAC